MKSLRSWALLISVMLVCGVATQAQSSGISGTIRVQHRPLASAGVSVYLLNAQGTKTVSQWATLSAGDGSFALRSLPFGTYVVVVRFQGKIIYQGKMQLNSPNGQQLPIDVN
jgi:Carboxypeptidase regulatory-like domain